MKPNIGRNDRILRLVTGSATTLLGIYLSSGILVIAGLFTLFESLSSWCVFYQLIGKNTCPIGKKDRSLIPFFKILLGGWLILLVAIVLNYLAQSINYLTWHDVLTSQTYPTNIDNILFLLIVYPFSLGSIFYFFIKK